MFFFFFNQNTYFISGTSTGVAFDQIPQASLEEIMDGGTFVTPTYDEIALCSAAFRVLRSMVNLWFRDVVLHKNSYADFQMVHFYRYLYNHMNHITFILLTILF